jgi:MFS family permease
MGCNAVSIIIPLRMADQSLSYSSIGGVMASFSVGMFAIKLFIGRHSDLVGQKVYAVLALSTAALFVLLIAFAKSTTHYIVLLGLVGVCRGAFTSINTSYTLELSKQGEQGAGFGKILGITSLLSALGGVMAGALYKFQQGKFAFIAVSVLLALSATFTVIFMRNPAKKNSEKLVSKGLFANMDKTVYLFCVVMFLQTFITSPMWSTIVPMHFYKSFTYTALALGIAMSMDEFISSPVNMIGGYIADRVNVKKMICIGYVLAAIVGALMLLAGHALIFLAIFLVCSVFVTSTYISVPKAESYFVRDTAKGFEFTLISICASVGDALGNVVLGRVMDAFSIKAGILMFSVTYVIIAVIVGVKLKIKTES